MQFKDNRSFNENSCAGGEEKYMIDLQGKTALVTGAASGIGRAAALRLAEAGARVVVSDIDADGGLEAVNLIRDGGGEAAFVRCDVTQASQVANLIDEAMRLFGRLDCAVNNAGIGGEMSPLHEKTEDEWQRVMDVNVRGVWLCMKYEIPAMLANGGGGATGGSIVNVASVAGLVGFRGGALYSASKHAVIGLTRTAALELARRSVRVNAVCPSFVETPLVSQLMSLSEQMARQVVTANPMRRLGHPDEVADAVVWLCSDASSFVTGQAIALDGGLTAG
jgi:NAD(P)-dependent dehydrogenase (short-subunit alcohol dehydrogenase family)